MSAADFDQFTAEMAAVVYKAACERHNNERTEESEARMAEEGDGYAVMRIERADMTAEEIAEAEAAWAEHTEKITVKVDEETDSDEWWSELRADADLRRWEDRLKSSDEIAMERGEYLKLAALPGFETGDKHAPTVLMIVE